ncbi:hypothetical protein EVAR_21945_1 [Eumeta japonica]|uniref:Uncharacterized protein n=1 Tax=Eumeta variegata TaxID=151549 RepID=A0A4C1VVU2_EUMVA|nr:hypothetical protein EVAR_21945_1 [Eumeta japonica]
MAQTPEHMSCIHYNPGGTAIHCHRPAYASIGRVTAVRKCSVCPSAFCAHLCVLCEQVYAEPQRVQRSVQRRACIAIFSRGNLVVSITGSCSFVRYLMRHRDPLSAGSRRALRARRVAFAPGAFVCEPAASRSVGPAPFHTPI